MTKIFLIPAPGEIKVYNGNDILCIKPMSPTAFRTLAILLLQAAEDTETIVSFQKPANQSNIIA